LYIVTFCSFISWTEKLQVGGEWSIHVAAAFSMEKKILEDEADYE
jgi:hypothetical protein